MQQEKDYLQRDIERISLFLKILLRKVVGLNNEDFQPECSQLEKDLQEQVDFSMQELSQLDEVGLKDKIAPLHLAHIDKLVEIAFEILKKSNPENKEKICRNILFMIEHLNKESDTFSLQRIQIKEELEKHL
ncbi:MAG: hypothetical protein AAGC45_07880 [Bacteroidota bacterium]